jgi:hypothetical protein
MVLPVVNLEAAGVVVQPSPGDQVGYQLVAVGVDPQPGRQLGAAEGQSAAFVVECAGQVPEPL